ncbi:hypothetical protein [Curtobacterium sp. 9128]|uniref:hypothetical protein n=1 Tax=Curtobacterium sp. 9128 TaxID=1793722 RepID=UPI0016432CEF|nr:hypothetical protein [Curtobacterium sp. 9128]
MTLATQLAAAASIANTMRLTTAQHLDRAGRALPKVADRVDQLAEPYTGFGSAAKDTVEASPEDGPLVGVRHALSLDPVKNIAEAAIAAPETLSSAVRLVGATSHYLANVLSHHSGTAAAKAERNRALSEVAKHASVIVGNTPKFAKFATLSNPTAVIAISMSAPMVAYALSRFSAYLEKRQGGLDAASAATNTLTAPPPSATGGSGLPQQTSGTSPGAPTPGPSAPISGLGAGASVASVVAAATASAPDSGGSAGTAAASGTGTPTVAGGPSTSSAPGTAAGGAAGLASGTPPTTGGTTMAVHADPEALRTYADALDTFAEEIEAAKSTLESARTAAQESWDDSFFDTTDGEVAQMLQSIDPAETASSLAEQVRTKASMLDDYSS